MDQTDKVQIMEQVKSYGEWIELGKQYAESDRDFAVQCYEKALELTEDKYEPYLLIAQAHRMFGSTQFVLETLPLALDLANDQVDRLIAIACEYKYITYDQHALEINGWVKELDPTFDGEVPKTYEDYQEIFKEYIIECRTINRIHCASRSIDRIIELSENKIDDLIEIGRQILLLEKIELSQKYFNRALEIQPDKYGVLMKIGDAYMNSKLYDSSLKYFIEANQLSPDILTPKLRIAQIKLELQQFQEALDYINNLIIPQESQIYLDLGLLLSNYEATLNEGKVIILKGLDLTANKFETLKELINKLWGKQINKFLLQKALEINAENLELAEFYGQHMSSYQNEKSQDTIDAFQLILKLDPKNIYYAYPLERAYIELGQFIEAIEFFKQYALTLQAQEEELINLQIENLLRIGSLLQKNNQLDEAFKYLQQAIELDPSPTKQKTLSFSVGVFYRDNTYEYCIKLCEQYEKYSPQDSYFYKAQISIKLNRIQEAVNFYELYQQISFDNEVQEELDGLKFRLQRQEEEGQQNEKTE